MSGGGNAPESWDQDLTTPVTRLNINATEFVPSWLPKESAVNPEAEAPSKSDFFVRYTG